MVKTVGILALQGAVAEHAQAVKKCGQQPLLIKKPSELSLIDALIIPGGESTTIGKLLVKYGFVAPLKELIQAGLPVFGTCAGLILLAKKVADGTEQPLLGLMEMQVRRNAFGRQVDSFETNLQIANWPQPFKAVFIRAPWIEKVAPTVKVLASYNGKAVLAEEKNMLAAAFHPELTNDLRLHQYFLSKVR
jgi:5'-phosphate synthase pdxT subunit